MRHYFAYTVVYCLMVIFITGCNRPEPKANIPDVQSIYGDIIYLDSLLQSDNTDSISSVASNIETTLAEYQNRAQSPDDRIILDSISRIHLYVNQFLRFCIDSRSDLELLNQDIASVETSYKSGKIKSGYYITSLLESEQILVNLNNRYEGDRIVVLRALENYDLLKSRLSTLPSVPF